MVDFIHQDNPTEINLAISQVAGERASSYRKIPVSTRDPQSEYGQKFLNQRQKELFRQLEQLQEFANRSILISNIYENRRDSNGKPRGTEFGFVLLVPRDCPKLEFYSPPSSKER